MSNNDVFTVVNHQITQFVKEQIQKGLTPESNTSISLRLPTALDNLLDELAITLDKSKTELLLWFITSGVQALEKEVEDLMLVEQEKPTARIAGSPRTFMLNTNFTNDPSTHFDMLQKQEAAAFCDSHKYVIERLREGDIVYLYQSTNGIVACGIVASGVIKSNYYGKEEDKYAVKLENFKSGFSPITAKQFKKLAQKGANFRMTLVELDATQHEVLKREIETRMGQ